VLAACTRRGILPFFLFSFPSSLSLSLPFLFFSLAFGRDAIAVSSRELWRALITAPFVDVSWALRRILFLKRGTCLRNVINDFPLARGVSVARSSNERASAIAEARVESVSANGGKETSLDSRSD